MKVKNNNRKNLFHAIALGAFILGNVQGCNSFPADYSVQAPEEKIISALGSSVNHSFREKRNFLEQKLDETRGMQNYTMEIKKGDLFVGINPVRYNNGKAGYIMEIRDKRGNNEYIDTMLEVYEDKAMIYDKTIGKNRLAGINCYAEEIKIQTPAFWATFNKSCQMINNKKEFSEWTHVYGKVFGRDVTIIDIDGDKKPDSVFFGGKLIPINPDKKLEKMKLEKMPAEGNERIIEESTRLFDRAQKYFSENVGSFEEIKF